MAYQFDVDLDPVASVGERITEATGQVDEDQQTEAGELAKVATAAALELGKLAPQPKGAKRTVSVVGHVGDGAAKLAVAVRVA